MTPNDTKPRSKVPTLPDRFTNHGASLGSTDLSGTPTVRLTIAIVAPILMILPTGLLIAAFVNAWVTGIWALILTAMILVGIVLAVITGFTPRAEKMAAGGSAA